MEPTLPCGFSGTQQQRIERIDRAQKGPERAASVGLVRVPVSLEPSDEELLQPFHEDGALLVGLEELLAKPVGGMQHLGLTHGLCTHQGQVGGAGVSAIQPLRSSAAGGERDCGEGERGRRDRAARQPRRRSPRPPQCQGWAAAPCETKLLGGRSFGAYNISDTM